MIRSRERRDPGAVLSGALSVTVHVLLLSVLFFGISWKTKQPAPVMAELWSALPQVAPPQVAPPRPEPVVQPKPEPKPEPPPPPKVEAKPQPKPDIALEEERKKKEEQERKQREEQQRVKEEKERKAREEAAERKRAEDEKRRLETENRERIQKELTQELAAATPQSAPLTGPPTVAGDPRAMDDWRGRIVAKVRPNIVIPPGITGNPEAVFDVELLPTGEVLSAKMRKSSGVKAYDEAVERAIYKSSPFPLPPQRQVFQRDLRLTFRPQD